MGVYSRWIFPRLVDWAMRNEEVTGYRKMLLALARGRVLDVGIGSGLNFPFYPEAVEQIIGLDPSAELLRLAAGRHSQSPRPVYLVQGSAEQIPLGDECVDTVIGTWTLCSIPRVRQALAEIRRVLTRDGQFLYVEHGLAPEAKVARWQNRLDPLWVRVSCHLDRPMDALISEAGFSAADIRTGYLGRGPKLMTYMYCGRATPIR